MQPLDWLVVLGYFGILFGVAWWVIKSGKETTDDYFLAGRNLGWFVVGASIFASNIGSEHLVGLAGSGATSGVALAHYELHAWCLLVLGWVLVPFYMRSMVYTMPEFLERRFSPASRWVLSLISLVAYVITKIAVGIFAGGVVFGTLLPEMSLQLGSMTLNSFWIGSVLVVVLTGLYTVAGGMKAVAYTEALQTIILVLGSLVLTFYGLNALGGWDKLREVLGPEMFNLWKPLVPAGMEGTWAPVKESGADRLVLQRQLPVAGDAVLRADHRPLVLVHRSVHRATHARRAEPDRSPPRHDLRRLPQAPARLHLHHPRHDRAGAGQDRPGRRPERAGRRERQRRPGAGAGGVPADGPRRAADRHPRHRRGRPARGAHELARRRLQRLLDPLHHRLLFQVPPQARRRPSSCGSAAWRPR